MTHSLHLRVLLHSGLVGNILQLRIDVNTNIDSELKIHSPLPIKVIPRWGFCPPKKVIKLAILYIMQHSLIPFCLTLDKCAKDAADIRDVLFFVWFRLGREVQLQIPDVANFSKIKLFYYVYLL